jgi:hypothetical protein
VSPNRPETTPGVSPESDADEAAARIAELVRRSTQGERSAGRGPTSTEIPPHGGTTSPTQALPGVAPREGRSSPLEAAPPTVADPVDRGPDRPSGRRHPLADGRVLVGVGAVVALLVAGLALAAPDEPPVAKPTQTVSPAVPGGYAVKVHDTLSDCRRHSRGQVQRAFADTPCDSVQRLLATGTVRGRPVLYVVSRITMPEAADAAKVKVVIDGHGTGNVNDLLREGDTFPGAPHRMPSSGYASLQDGAVLVVAEAGFIDGGASSSTDPALRAAAAAVASHVADGTA